MRRVLTAVAAALLVVAFAAGCASTPETEGQPPNPTRAAPPTPAPLSAGALQDPARDAEWRPPAAHTPARVRIPAIGVDAHLESLGIGEDRTLDAPVDFDSAGWFAEGVVPGDIGPAIIAGHVDSASGPAVFARLHELMPGNEILVELSDGTVRTFVVAGAQQSAKAQFPTSDVYDAVPRPELRLITCAGVFDGATSHYRDNLIVYASIADD